VVMINCIEAAIELGSWLSADESASGNMVYYSIHLILYCSLYEYNNNKNRKKTKKTKEKCLSKNGFIILLITNKMYINVPISIKI